MWANVGSIDVRSDKMILQIKSDFMGKGLAWVQCILGRPNLASLFQVSV